MATSVSGRCHMLQLCTALNVPATNLTGLNKLSDQIPQPMASKDNIQPQNSLEVQTGSILQSGSDQKSQSMASR